MPQPDRPQRALPDGGEGVDHQVVQALTLGEPRAQRGGLFLEFVVGQRLDRVFPGIDPADELHTSDGRPVRIAPDGARVIPKLTG